MTATRTGALAWLTPWRAPARVPSAEERIAFATQFQLTWWRFRKHRLAVWSGIVVMVFYLLAVLADFIAYTDPHATDSRRSYIPPQAIHLLDDDGAFRPWVHGLKGKRDLKTFKIVYTVDPDSKLYLRFFADGYRYHLFGLIPTTTHLFGVANGKAEDGLYLLGTDLLGRDVWSRLAVATRISLFIGLAGVTVSLFLGVLLGGISGLYGGAVDTVIQRLIEIIRSIPTIPLWMGLAAALPNDWTTTQIYFAITVIISFIGWTDLARVVRGKFLSLREEDFVTAAELSGAGQLRIIFRHMLPSFTSHIIASVTLAIPGTILGETALSFLGLGLRQPAISWGVLLQDAQNLQAVALAPWLMLPALPLIATIMAFNFLGDGLRDAADPYAR